MARTKSFASLKNRLKSEIRKKTRVQPLKQKQNALLGSSSNTQNTNGK